MIRIVFLLLPFFCFGQIIKPSFESQKIKYAQSINVEDLAIGMFIYIKDISIDGCEFLAPPSSVVVGVKTARTAILETVDNEDDEESPEESETSSSNEEEKKEGASSENKES